LPVGDGVTGVLAADILTRIGAAFTVCVAAAVMSMFLLTVFGRSAMAIFAYYGILYLSNLILVLFRLSSLVPYLLKTQFSSLSGRTPPDYGFVLTVSAVTFAVFFAGGLAALRKKDMA